jgi:hypothetical protein
MKADVSQIKEEDKMDKQKIINGLKTLKDKGECVSQTLILEEAINLLESGTGKKNNAIWYLNETAGYIPNDAKRVEYYFDKQDKKHFLESIEEIEDTLNEMTRAIERLKKEAETW